ncbi:hypothetical protein AMJ57_03180 [Parcubacteria bacterium SG8_24]|nr:MAG: hypothetical protein AMJ57_03180 [Parcubacteria bacterium SG8_24]
MRTVVLFSLLLTLLGPIDAVAADGKGDTDDDALDLEIYSGVDFFIGEVADLSVHRVRGIVGAELKLTPRLSVLTEVYVGRSGLSYTDTWSEGLGIEAQLATAVDVGLGAGLRLVLFQEGPLLLDTGLVFSTSPWVSDMGIAEARLDTAQGNFYLTSYARQHVQLNYTWNEIRADLRCRYDWGPVTSALRIGFERFAGKIDLELDSDSRELLYDLGYDPRDVARSRGFERVAPFLGPELGIRLGDLFSVSLGGTVAPLGDSWIFGGFLKLSLHL